MADSTHAPRRTPEPPDGPVTLADLAQQVLDQARSLDAGRAAQTLTPGAGAGLKQAILALVAGNRLQDHQAPGPATIQVLHGEVTLGTNRDEVHLVAGQWAIIPDELHNVAAAVDAAVLLTVAPQPR
jgi:quercetin dioxygenase-like cupin family protein